MLNIYIAYTLKLYEAYIKYIPSICLLTYNYMTLNQIGQRGLSILKGLDYKSQRGSSGALQRREKMAVFGTTLRDFGTTLSWHPHLTAPRRTSHLLCNYYFS